MKCKIEGCDNDIMYKNDQLCQKHYIRFYRYGTYDLTMKKRQYRRTHSRGYQLLYEPSHPLAQKSGYVYEHRFVLFNAYGDSLNRCLLCGKEWSIRDIYNSHIDHIDCDKSNNKLHNLRPLCNSCNISRPLKEIQNGQHSSRT